jgi:hypothetical protein
MMLLKSIAMLYEPGGNDVARRELILKNFEN